MNLGICRLLSRRLHRHPKAGTRRPIVRLATRLRLIVLCGLAAFLAASGAASAANENVLYSFCALGQFCTDGADPAAGLTMDAAGNLYGTTVQGGADRNGTVFELTPNAAKTSWTETVLHSFGSQSGDGVGVYAGLIMDAAGNLYGTTSGSFLGSPSGPYFGGTVFELTPNAAKTSWTETVLYSFCPSGASCTDGELPYAGLIMDAAGNLYGTTNSGGAHGGGTVFELIPNAAKTMWSETVLYSFCPSGASCTDGELPYAGLIMDAAGNLYGTTNSGGAHGGGTVFELIPNAAKTMWSETVLYSFCAQGGCVDGDGPYAGLIMDAAGNLYGTTVQGGAHGGYGTVFELTPNAAKTKWSETVLYSFCAQGGKNCTDGLGPLAGLIMDAAGNLYGTTSGAFLGSPSGPYIGGTVFELTPNAAKTSWTETVLYSFCAQSSCTDGSFPDAGLIVDATGGLYGTTYYGGAHAGLLIPPLGGGTVFEITGSGFVTPVVLPPSEVAATASGLAYSRVSHTFNGTVTITNVSSGTISGPFSILLTGLTTGVTLANATGNFSGSPYLTVPAVASLAPGQSAAVGVQFDNPTFGTINFTPVIYSGSL